MVSLVNKAMDPLSMAMAKGPTEVRNRTLRYLHKADRKIIQLKKENE